jgi:predicted ATPase
VVDLGEHRLKDLSLPERIFGLAITGLRTDFPPLKTLNAVVNNLPGQLTTFLGRDKELAQTQELLARTRLLTLLGPGGTGKTRLALQTAAAAADRYPDGVYFVPLAAVTDATLVLPTLTQVLGLAQPGSGSRDRLVDYLATRRMLLVLDNFEQVVDAGAALAELLAAAPQVSVLVTSRIALRVYGEREFQVPPLDLPDPQHLPPLDVLACYDSVALFVERAQGVRPDFDLTPGNAAAVAEICARLDGLPLAIELAAARIRLLSPDAIREKLGDRLGFLAGGARDLPERQQTLRGAIAWSFDLLDEEDRRFFARFAVFAGGAELAAVEEVVCDAGVPGCALVGVESLLDKSLIRFQAERATEPRYGMLETIREFAQQRLVECGEGDLVAGRHARWVAALVEHLAGAVTGPERREVLDRFEAEHDNIRAALGWLLATGRSALASRVFAGTWRYWQARGFLAEARQYAERVMALPVDPEARESRRAAAEAAGGIAYWQGDNDASLGWYTEALDLARETGDDAVVANALYNITFPVGQSAGGLRQAVVASEEAMALFRRVGDQDGVGRALWGLATTHYFHGLVDDGLVYARQALTVFEDSGDLFMTGWSQYMVGTLVMSHDRVDARQHLVAAHRLFARADDTSGHALVFDALGTLAWREGDVARAMRLAGFVGRVESTSGSGLAKLNRDLAGFHPEALAKDPVLAAAYEEGRRLTMEEATELALPGEQLGPPPGG